MKTISYDVFDMSDIRHRFREMAAITGGRDHDEYRDQIRSMMNMGMSCCLAQHNHRIVGTMGFTTCREGSIWQQRDALKKTVENRGIDPKTVQLRSMIYVDPDFRGQGISSAMEKTVAKVSLELGFKYRLGIHYDSPEIYHWASRRDGCVDLGVMDPGGSGFPVILIPIA